MNEEIQVIKKCLLVIDVQSAMFNLPRPLFNAEKVLKNIMYLIRKARNENVPVMFLQHCGSEKSPFFKGTDGWNIHPSIKPETNDHVIEKIYSDAFLNTELNELLKQMGINNIVASGLVTEGCVDTTVRRAFSLGYKIELASDCHSTTDSSNLTAEQIINHHNEVLKIFSEVKESKEIVFR